jgi:putative endonuclease
MQHNAGETVSIKHGIPWTLIGYIEMENRSKAMVLERQIKKRGIKRWLEEHRDIVIRIKY